MPTPALPRMVAAAAAGANYEQVALFKRMRSRVVASPVANPTTGSRRWSSKKERSAEMILVVRRALFRGAGTSQSWGVQGRFIGVSPSAVHRTTPQSSVLCGRVRANQGYSPLFWLCNHCAKPERDLFAPFFLVVVVKTADRSAAAIHDVPQQPCWCVAGTG